MNRLVCCIFFFFIHAYVISLAQDVRPFRQSAEPHEIASQLFSQGKYFEAIAYYERALEDPRNRANTELLYNLAECYRMNRLYQKATGFYQQVYDMNSSRYPLCLFWLARMKKNTENYKEAAEAFSSFAKTRKPGDPFFSEAQKESRICDSLAKNKIPADTSSPVLLPENINKGETSCFRGVISRDTLWFLSSTKEQIKEEIKLDNVTGSYKEYYVSRLYYTWKKNGAWQDPVMAEIPLENKKIHIASFFPDTLFHRWLITLCEEKNNDLHCYLCQSSSSKGNFTKPVPLESPVNKENSSSKDPMVSVLHDVPYLFFVSDRNPSKKYDIYYGKIEKDGKIKKVDPLPDAINTPREEHSPFYDAQKGILYFSSTGHDGLGEYDIFCVNGNPAAGWGKVKNMGAPVNSGADDYYYYVNSDQPAYSFALISSNRPTGKNQNYSTLCDHLFEYKNKTNIAPPVISTPAPALPPKTITLICFVMDEETKKPLYQDSIKIYEKSTHAFITSWYGEASNRAMFQLNRDSSYIIESSRKEYFPGFLALSFPSLRDTVVQPIYLKKIPLPPPAEVVSEKITPEAIPVPEKMIRTEASESDKNDWESLIARYGDVKKPYLHYRVQIGAYRKPNENIQAKMRLFSYLQNKLDILFSIETEGELKRYVTNRLETLNEANEYKQRIRTAGIHDAFIVPYYKGNRIKFKELEALLSEK